MTELFHDLQPIDFILEIHDKLEFNIISKANLQSGSLIRFRNWSDHLTN